MIGRIYGAMVQISVFVLIRENILSKKKSLDGSAISEVRFFDNEELKYFLRTLEKNALWINHVGIVTDR